MTDSSQPITGLREPFSCLSHAVGAVLAVLGTGVLLALSQGHPHAQIAFLVYGISLILLYLASALYHGLHHQSPWLQRFDHMAIYLVIAGSYVPIAVLALPPLLGRIFLIAQGSLALVGVAANLFFGGGPKWLRLVLYLVMGWMAIGALGPLQQNLSPAALGWLFAGGLFYTVGTVVYATRRPHLWPGTFGSHDLWHLFVLAGSASHYLMTLDLARSLR